MASLHPDVLVTGRKAGGCSTLNFRENTCRAWMLVHLDPERPPHRRVFRLHSGEEIALCSRSADHNAVPQLLTVFGRTDRPPFAFYTDK
jgi:hypothetical protein